MVITHTSYTLGLNKINLMILDHDIACPNYFLLLLRYALRGEHLERHLLGLSWRPIKSAKTAGASPRLCPREMLSHDSEPSAPGFTLVKQPATIPEKRRGRVGDGPGAAPRGAARLGRLETGAPLTLTGFAPVSIQYSFVLACICTYAYVFCTY